MVNQPQFDVFLAHNSQDKPQVRAIATELKRRSLNCWIEEEQIPPGRWSQDVIQRVIPHVKSAAIFIGPVGLGKWQVVKLRTLISRCVEANIPVIPVLLPGVVEVPQDLLFLKELNWVGFTNGIDDVEALDNLEWGITGQKPEPKSSIHKLEELEKELLKGQNEPQKITSYYKEGTADKSVQNLLEITAIPPPVLPPPCVKLTKVIEEQPVHIVIASISSVQTNTISLDLEVEALQLRLSQRTSNTFKISKIAALLWDELLQQLCYIKPHILHLVAQGNECDLYCKQNGIYYCALLNQITVVESLRVLIFNVQDSRHDFNHRESFERPISIPSAEGVWEMLATRTPINSTESLNFTKFLYKALAAGYSLTSALEFACKCILDINTQDSSRLRILMYENACVVIPFPLPPLASPPNWAAASPLPHKKIRALRQKVGNALEELSQLQVIIDNQPSSEVLRILNKEPTLIEEVLAELTEIEYSADLTAWIDKARRLAHDVYNNFDTCFQAVEELVRLKNNTGVYRKKLNIARQTSKQAYKQGEKLNSHFEELLLYAL